MPYVVTIKSRYILYAHIYYIEKKLFIYFCFQIFSKSKQKKIFKLHEDNELDKNYQYKSYL